MADADVKAYNDAYARRVIRGDLDKIWKRTGRFSVDRVNFVGVCDGHIGCGRRAKFRIFLFLTLFLPT